MVDEGSKGIAVLNDYEPVTEWFVGGYKADSFLHRGLQVADILAYLLRRSKERRKPKYISEFKEFIKEVC